MFEKIPHEHVDLADVMGKIIERAEKGEGSMLHKLLRFSLYSCLNSTRMWVDGDLMKQLIRSEWFQGGMPTVL